MKFPAIFIFLLLPMLIVSSCVMELGQDPLPEENLGMESLIIPDGFDFEMYNRQNVNVGFTSGAGRLSTTESMQYAIIGSDLSGGYHNLQSGHVYLADGLDITVNRPLHIKELTLYTKYKGNARFYSLGTGPLQMTIEDMIIDDAEFETASSRVASTPDCDSFLGNATKIDCKKDEVEIKSSASFLSVDINFYDGTVKSYTPGQVGEVNSNANKWVFADEVDGYGLGQIRSFTVYADCKTSPREVGTALVTFANPCADPEADSDGDGVSDEDDIAPDDEDVASARYLPAYERYATFAFEDSWPFKGDYDFNDLVVSHNASVLINSASDVTKVEYDLVIRAIGARYNNDLNISFTDPQHSMQVESTSPATLKYEVVAVDNISELRLLQVRNYFNTNDIVNTDISLNYKEPVHISLVLLFDGSVNVEDFNIDEYLRINQEIGREVHKPGMPFTSLIDLSLIGDGDDDTTPEAGKYYKTSDNLPWVLEIPIDWEYPKEYVDITKAYPRFKDFAQGNSDTPWYTNDEGNQIEEYIYKK